MVTLVILSGMLARRTPPSKYTFHPYPAYPDQVKLAEL
jgi:hypothetical protein